MPAFLENKTRREELRAEVEVEVDGHHYQSIRRTAASPSHLRRSNKLR
jgi:hypothetical protein